jgi:hypothetical protein
LHRGITLDLSIAQEEEPPTDEGFWTPNRVISWRSQQARESISLSPTGAKLTSDTSTKSKKTNIANTETKKRKP